jgi:MFS family permease
MAEQNHRTRLFVGCVIALVATAFGFVVRGAILDDWRVQFNLTGEQIGILVGVGLYPFAISIILFSLIVDRIGYGVSMVIAFLLHASSAVITMCAPLMLAGEGASPEEVAAGQRMGMFMLYLGTFIFALGNGTVEAVINPVTATLYPRQKTHYLNILHAGWPGGLVLGGLLAIVVLLSGDALGAALPGQIWQWQVGLVLLPTIAYGLILMGQKFPIQERVAAGASYMDMLREFGWGSCLIVLFLLVAGFNQILVVGGVQTTSPWWWLGIAAVLTIPFGLYVRSFGRPMFVFLLLVMFLLATTELGTDGWIQDIMGSVLASQTTGILFLVWTATIMFVLRFFAGPIVHRISPLGLLAASAAVASIGLFWLSSAGSALIVLFLAATFYGFGKTFFWPTTLGVVSEQYPRGGALLLNAIAGVGMISVGTIGGPLIGTAMDRDFHARMQEENPALLAQVLADKSGLFGEYEGLDQNLLAELPAAQQEEVNAVATTAKQATLGRIAILPAIMLVCYVILIFHFRSKGGYKAEVLTGHAADDEKFTGGVKGPMEA